MAVIAAKTASATLPVRDTDMRYASGAAKNRNPKAATKNDGRLATATSPPQSNSMSPSMHTPSKTATHTTEPADSKNAVALIAATPPSGRELLRARHHRDAIGQIETRHDPHDFLSAGRLATF